MTGLHDSTTAETAIAALLARSSERIADRVLDLVTVDDFASAPARAVVAAVTDMRADGVEPDTAALIERLRRRGDLQLVGGENGVDALATHLPAVGAVRQLCRDIADHARWRRREAALFALEQACGSRDLDAWTQAEEQLADVEAGKRAGGWLTPHDVASRLFDALSNADDVRLPWPLDMLNRISGGGARRGQMTFIAGPSSHGKSAFIDMALHSMSKPGTQTALFVNEMTPEERAERIAARIAKVKYSRILEAGAGLLRLRPDEEQAILKAMGNQPVAMVPCAGWGVKAIIREARRRKVDVMALDLVQKLPHESGRKRHETLESAVQHLDAFAKETGCHVIIAGQLNRERANGTWPVPGLADIKDCAELGNGPDNVLFVWRQQDETTLDPLDEGLIRVAKYRGAPLISIPIYFRGEFQQFEQQPPHAQQIREGVAA